ncbi:MAG: hypothetical protein DWQ19_12420 [Crenarchaeota archaeon]|nr:MAG: hypothetical protein DWQ19_12420 [Thermoproteota archaeon]
MNKIRQMLNRILGRSIDEISAQGSPQGLYLLNDPTTPDLVVPQVLPKRPENLSFTVNEFHPTKLNSKDLRDNYVVNTYITVCNVANYFQSVVSGFDRPVKGWAATPNLTILPFAGKKLNAFYNRSSLQFFYAPNPHTNKMIYTSASAEIVSHELGHALLDILRPDLWNVQALEVWAFHEAFSDITTIANALHYDDLIVKMLEETKGSLMNTNILSKLAEELGGASKKSCIRDVSEVYNYVDPHKLPQKAEGNTLCAEPHNFSRVFSGAWYELLVRIYEKEKGKMGDIKAIKHARDVAYSRLLKATIISPNTIKFFDGLAKCMVATEKMKGNAYTQIFEEVFMKRGILRPVVKILSNLRYTDVLHDLEKEDQISKKGDVIVTRKPRPRKMVIANYWVSDLSSSNPLYNVELEVPGDSYYLFDDKQLIDESHPDDSEILESSVLCALSVKNYQGLGENEMWEIKNNKLIRNHVFCGCFTAT